MVYGEGHRILRPGQLPEEGSQVDATGTLREGNPIPLTKEEVSLGWRLYIPGVESVAVELLTLYACFSADSPGVELVEVVPFGLQQLRAFPCRSLALDRF